jgi:hypothetical protein
MAAEEINSLEKHFSNVNDPRGPNVTHQWFDIIAIAILGTICGADGWVEIEQFGYQKLKWVQALHPVTQGQVSAWAEQNQLVLGQRQVAEKSNEITAIPALLRLLEIKDCIVTVDAIGTQTKIAQQIIQAEGDYLLAVKHNQG